MALGLQIQIGRVEMPREQNPRTNLKSRTKKPDAASAGVRSVRCAAFDMIFPKLECARDGRPRPRPGFQTLTDLGARTRAKQKFPSISGIFLKEF